MKKLVLILLLAIGLIGVKSVNAQNATNSASDHGVPISVITPQANPSIGVNAVNAPAITVPTAPPVQTFAPPLISPTPTLSAPNLLPAVPPTPNAPAPPAPGTPAPTSTFSTTLNLPFVPTLPPIPPIPPMPDLRLPIGSN
ncbi:MAG: hypothetical protein V4541_05080 [Bacteroidota bacterium]